MKRVKTREECKTAGYEFNQHGDARDPEEVTWINHKMLGQTLTPEFKQQWFILPWMLAEEEVKADRHNKGKIDLSLLPVEACLQEAKVWMQGEKKYSRNNWKKLWGNDTPNVVMASALRHMFAILDGEEIDEESGCYHAALIRCNMAMLLEYYKNKRES